MVKKELSILIPAYNEEKTVAKIIQKIPSFLEINKRVILVDDGSIDDTAKVAKKAGAIIISNKKNLGLGKSFKIGLKESLQNKADIIVILDADGQYNPKTIKHLILPILNNEADLVLGNRFFFNTKYELGFLNKLANKILSIFLSKCLLRVENVYDIQSSFRAFNRKFGMCLKIRLKAIYNYAQEMFLLAHFYGFKIKQIPVDCYKREVGKSKLIKFSIFHFLKVFFISLRTFIKLKVVKSTKKNILYKTN
jgi:glycosyltransferase involved in cell wall biosynthesis